VKLILKNTKGFTLIEVVLILAILLSILLIIARFVFAHELKEWENNIWRSIGAPPELARFIAGILFFGYLIWRVIVERKKRKRKSLLE
jgi:hypothetical protein